MAEKRHKREKHRLRYPLGEISPDTFLHFVQLGAYTRQFGKLDLDDEDQRALEILIMADPKGAPVVPGTGGLRKMRFSSNRWEYGKRGGLRVCYVYLEEHAFVALVAIYRKSQKDDLSATEKTRLKELIERLKRAM